MCELDDGKYNVTTCERCHRRSVVCKLTGSGWLCIACQNVLNGGNLNDNKP